VRRGKRYENKEEVVRRGKRYENKEEVVLASFGGASGTRTKKRSFSRQLMFALHKEGGRWPALPLLLSR
jgi:hypothetical protein